MLFLAQQQQDRRRLLPTTPSLCYARDLKKIAVIGGKPAETNYVGQTTVELYDLLQDQWSALPELQLGRWLANSCDHGGFLYVFAGAGMQDNRGQISDTIERLNKSCLRGQASNWELIQPNTGVLHPRRLAAMVSLDARTYMILGG